jgi:hypothetical protein
METKSGHESHWKNCLPWDSLQAFAEDILLWLPWKFPTNWNVNNWVVIDTPVKLPDGRWRVSEVMLTEQARSQDNWDWLPLPVLSSARPDHYSKSAAMTVLAHPKYQKVTTLLAAHFRAFTSDVSVAGSYIGAR